MIRDRGVAHRYANALFGAALEESLAETVLEDLHSLETLYEQDASFQNMLDAPYILTEHKVELIRTLLDGRVADLVVRFLLLMVRKKRVQHLPLVFEHYRDLVEDHLGIQRARVTTAVPLEGSLAEQIRTRLERITSRTVHLEHRVDPSIIGGVVVTIDGRIIDSSIRHRLNLLRDHLLATQVV